MSLAQRSLGDRPDRSNLDADRGMRMLEWLVVAMCSIAVAILSFVH